MTTRPAERPLVGPPVRSAEVVLGADRAGRPVASVRPLPLARSGVVTLTDPAVVRALIVDLGIALDHLETSAC